MLRAINFRFHQTFFFVLLRSWNKFEKWKKQEKVSVWKLVRIMKHVNVNGLPFRRIPWYELAARLWQGCLNGREEIEESPIFLLPSNGDDSDGPDWSSEEAQERRLYTWVESRASQSLIILYFAGLPVLAISILRKRLTTKKLCIT